MLFLQTCVNFHPPNIRSGNLTVRSQCYSEQALPVFGIITQPLGQAIIVFMVMGKGCVHQGVQTMITIPCWKWECLRYTQLIWLNLWREENTFLKKKKISVREIMQCWAKIDSFKKLQSELNWVVGRTLVKTTLLS